MFNPLIGKDQTFLEAELASLQQQLLDGKTVVQSGAGDATATERIEVKIHLRVEQVLAALYFLDQAGQVQPPGKYPREQCFRCRRTTPRYLWGA